MGDEESKRKRGRPKKDGSKSAEIHVRLSDEELNMLRYVCDKENKSMSAVLTEGLKTKYNLSKFR